MSEPNDSNAEAESSPRVVVVGPDGMAVEAAAR